MTEQPMQADFDAVFIRRWLLRFGDLVALAESPGTAHGLTRSGPTPETPRLSARQHGYSGDHMEWACVKADIERAWLTLTYNSIESRIVEALMQGHRLSDFGRVYRKPRHVVDDALDRAVERMADVLAGESPGPSFEVIMSSVRECAADDCSNPVDVTRGARFCSSRCRLRAWRAARLLPSG